jgi:ABC-type branched-subunit amino acid transport system ATPase component
MLYIYMISIDSNESNKLINNIHTLEEMRQKALLFIEHNYIIIE